MNEITKQEAAISVHGAPARAFNVVRADNGRILNQRIKTFAREYMEHGRKQRLSVELRFDDSCNNGHETFAITADGHELDRGAWRESIGGCCHDEIARRFPELAPLIQWHLVSTDGPMHYEGNVVYLAGDRDCWGLRKDEVRQIRNGKTGELAWIRKGKGTEYHDGPTPPAESYVVQWEPWNRIGEGKARELDAARSVAVWPEATDAELMQEPAALKTALAARLPALLERFKAAMLGAGFVYPEPRA